MNWLYKMEYKYGRKAPKNMTLVMVGGQILVWLIVMLAYWPLYDMLVLTRAGLFGGEVWRLLSFLFVPSLEMNPLLFALEMYIFYLLGSSLERVWGNFKFDVYLVVGILSAWVACLITGGASNVTLYYSIYFAFACLFPDHQFLLFFVLPVKVKWLGLIMGVLYVFQIAIRLFVGDFWGALAMVIGMANFLLFFGKGLWGDISTNIKAKKRQREWKNQWRDR